VRDGEVPPPVAVERIQGQERFVSFQGPELSGEFEAALVAVGSARPVVDRCCRAGEGTQGNR
jgi:hypothetical protein